MSIFSSLTSNGSIDLVAGDAHLGGQRPAGVVVGRLRGAAGILAHVGIFLLLEEGPGVGLVRLGHLDHERAGRIELSAGDEIGLGLMDFDAAHHQDVEHLEHRRVVVLFGRDDEGVGLVPFDFLDRQFVHLVVSC